MTTETSTHKPSEPEQTRDRQRPPHVAVDPARLQHGQWCPTREEYVGEGDIVASYSADKIALAGVIRRPFPWHENLWVNVGEMHWGSQSQITAYRLEPAEAFAEEIVSYAEKTVDCEAARNDPLGFYHGMHVAHRGKVWVLCGPARIFVPGQTAQPGLFG